MSTGVADLVSRAVASIAQIPKGLFINGEWVEGSGAPIANRNPATGEIFAHVANATPDDAMRALDAAAAAQSGWRNLWRARGGRCCPIMPGSIRRCERAIRRLSSPAKIW